MREFRPSSVGLAGSLLIAHPNLLDPNFRKSVLFISSHDSEEGTFGLTLNRPSDQLVEDVLPTKDLGPLLRLPVFLGGPVGVDQLTFAAFSWQAGDRRLHCKHHLGLTEALESLDEENTMVRAFIGYAGWGKGQLEAEIAQSAWLVAKANADVLEGSQSLELWRQTLSGFGPWFQLVAESPDDLSNN